MTRKNLAWSVLAASIAIASTASAADSLSLQTRSRVPVDGEDGQVPGVAPAAMQMGRHVGTILRRELAGDGAPESRPAFAYRDKGTMATIGRARAVAQVAGLKLGGLVAWLLWSLIHVMFLISFRSKLFVMLSWAWTYLAFAKGARLITGHPPPRKRPKDENG